MNNSCENLEAPRGFLFYIFKNKKISSIIYVYKKETIYMSWTNVKITKEKINDFFNSIDTDILAKNVDAMLDQLDQEKYLDKS